MKGDPTLPEIGQDLSNELRRPPHQSLLTRRTLLLGMAGVAGIAGIGGAAFWYGLSLGKSTQTATKTVVVATPTQETDLTAGNAQPGQQLLQMKVLGDVLDVDWSPDGKKILANHQVYADPFAGGITIWNAATGSVLWQEHQKKYYNSIWSPDSTRIASKLDGEVIVWDMHTRQTLFSCPGVKYVSRMAWSRDGKWLAINQGDGNRVYLFDGDTGISGPVCKGLTSPYAGLSDIDWSPDSKYIAGLSLDYRVFIWEADTGNLIKTYGGNTHRDEPEFLDWSLDGTTIATADEGKVYLWEALTGRYITAYQQATGAYDLSWSPIEKRLALITDEGVSILDIATERPILKLKNNATHRIQSLNWSPNGKMLVTGEIGDGIHENWATIWFIE